MTIIIRQWVSHRERTDGRRRRLPPSSSSFLFFSCIIAGLSHTMSTPIKGERGFNCEGGGGRGRRMKALTNLGQRKERKSTQQQWWRYFFFFFAREQLWAEDFLYYGFFLFLLLCENALGVCLPISHRERADNIGGEASLSSRVLKKGEFWVSVWFSSFQTTPTSSSYAFPVNNNNNNNACKKSGYQSHSHPPLPSFLLLPSPVDWQRQKRDFFHSLSLSRPPYRCLARQKDPLITEGGRGR